MFTWAGDFQQALYKTFVLTVTALTMAFIWAYCHLPAGNLLMVILAALTAVRIAELPAGGKQLQELAVVITTGALLQYIVAITVLLPLLNVLLVSLASWLVLRFIRGSSAHLVLLVGFLAYSAPPGAYAAAERAVDIVIAGSVAGFITLLTCSSKALIRTDAKEEKLSAAAAYKESVMLFCGTFLYRLLAMPQGIWIVLTIIFIGMIRRRQDRSIKLAEQRIFSVPAGIILGGIYSSAAVALDYRLAYLLILIAAAGFFMLYYRHDFFAFSLFFMFAFTVYADWMSGSLHGFNFRQLLLARTLATVIGAALLLGIEKVTAAGQRQRHEKIL